MLRCVHLAIELTTFMVIGTVIKYILSYLNPTKRSIFMNKLFYHTISLLTTVKPALVTTSIKQ
jgi:hypothetical protein